MLRSGRFAASWELVKESWNVLRSDKRLAIFPILSGLACALVTIVFLAPMVLAGLLDQALAGEQGARVLSAIVAFVFYFVMYFVIIFANAALVGAVLRKLDGQSATVSDGFRIALAHLGGILGYAAIAATVGMLLRWLRDQARQGNGAFAIIGQLGVGLAGRGVEHRHVSGHSGAGDRECRPSGGDQAERGAAETDVGRAAHRQRGH